MLFSKVFYFLWAVEQIPELDRGMHEANKLNACAFVKTYEYILCCFIYAYIGKIYALVF